jgi:hypothetical protein
VLHHDEVLALALVEAEVEHLDDVRVDETRGGQRLPAKARDEGRVVSQVLGEQLDRHISLEPLVEGQLNGGHTPDAEAALDAVPPDDHRAVSHPPPPLELPLAGPVPPLLPVSPPVVVPPPRPTPPVVVEVVPVSVGVVAVVGVVVVVVVVVLVGVVVLVEVLVEADVEVELVVEEVVGVEPVDAVCGWQSLWASWAIVLAPWLRLLRRVELTVAGRVWTSPERTALALTAAPQLPDWTADETASAWLLKALDWSPESRPEPPPQATTNDAANPSPPARMARGA